MDWYPLWNSLRIAGISCVIVFFLGIYAAHRIATLPRLVKGVLDVLLTLPLVLPPTVCGWILLLIFGLTHPVGIFLKNMGIQLVVAFPLMYRTARGAFESFNENLAWSARTLGLSERFIFWRIRLPACKQGIIAGVVLAFARALGEYGATSMLIGYIPGNTATISTTVYQLWRTNDEYSAFIWVVINIIISAIVLLTVNMMEKRARQRRAGGWQ